MGVRDRLGEHRDLALGSGLAAASGALLGPVFIVSPTMGDLVGLKAFAIVILGGLGSLPGATIGGFDARLRRGIRRRLPIHRIPRRLRLPLIILVLALGPQGLVPAKERIG